MCSSDLWSGVTSLVWGASKEDAEAAGFDEGDKPVAGARFTYQVLYRTAENAPETAL